MSSRLVTLVVAVGCSSAIVGVGWGVQAAVLPSPPRAELVASRAAAWFFRYRLVESTFHLNAGPSVTASCTQTWFRLPGGLADRGEVLRMGSAGIVTLRPHHLDVIPESARGPRWLPRAQLELGGCPRLLGDQIARAAVSVAAPRLNSVDVAGRDLLALRLRADSLRIVVLLAPHTDRPVGLSVSGGTYAGTSALRLAPVTPALLSTRGLGE